MERKNKWHPMTILQHGGYDGREQGGSLNPPLYLDIAPVQESVARAAEFFRRSEDGFTYARKGHRNARMLEKLLAELEGAEDALLFSSGMAATNCLFLDLVKPGQNVVSQQCVYGGTYGFLTTDFPDAGREAIFVKNQLDLQEWRGAINEWTAAIFVEMPSNPVGGLVDLKEIVAIANQFPNPIPVIVDNTFAPILFRPLEHGATFVLRSGSKYENPGNTSLLGFVIGPQAALSKMRNGRYERLGAPAHPLDCWLSQVGMRTLGLRMNQHSLCAEQVAYFLGQKSRVTRVHYPRHKDSPFRDLAAKYLPEGAGGIVTIELGTDKKGCARFVDSLQLFSHVISLGTTHSLVTYPAGTTHSKAPPEKRAAMGITDTMVRLSIGLEHPDDLMDDLEQALKKV